jgi:hypothetical protein
VVLPTVSLVLTDTNNVPEAVSMTGVPVMPISGEMSAEPVSPLGTDVTLVALPSAPRLVLLGLALSRKVRRHRICPPAGPASMA